MVFRREEHVHMCLHVPETYRLLTGWDLNNLNMYIETRISFIIALTVFPLKKCINLLLKMYNAGQTLKSNGMSHTEETLINRL